jgi:hypothetical protein
LVRESLEGDVLVPNGLEMLLGPSQRPLDEYMEGCVVVGAPVVEEPALRLDGPWDVDVKKNCAYPWCRSKSCCRYPRAAAVDVGVLPGHRAGVSAVKEGPGLGQRAASCVLLGAMAVR